MIYPIITFEYKALQVCVCIYRNKHQNNWHVVTELLRRFSSGREMEKFSAPCWLNYLSIYFNPPQFTRIQTCISRGDATNERSWDHHFSLDAPSVRLFLCREPAFLSLSFWSDRFYSLTRSMFPPFNLPSSLLSTRVFSHIASLFPSYFLMWTHHLRYAWTYSISLGCYSNRIRVSFVTLDRQDSRSILSLHLLFLSFLLRVSSLPRSVISLSFSLARVRFSSPSRAWSFGPRACRSSLSHVLPLRGPPTAMSPTRPRSPLTHFSFCRPIIRSERSERQRAFFSLCQSYATVSHNYARNWNSQIILHFENVKPRNQSRRFFFFNKFLSNLPPE